MKSTTTLTRMAVLIALGVAAAYLLPIPVYGAKLFPAQHAINVVAGVLLGPWLAGVVALVIAAIRIATGTGSPLAIPGSIFGAMLAGLLYRATRSYVGAAVGEVIGTGLIGALAAYPVALLFMPKANAAASGMTVYIIPFALSSLTGAILASLALPAVMRVARPSAER
jgi:energy-coupling factor transport system ATP-binding protein